MLGQDRAAKSERGDTRSSDPPGQPGVSDARLVEHILSGDGSEGAHELLVRRYWKVLVGHVRTRVRNQRDAEDIAQEAFIKAFRALGSLESPASFLAWLLRIAENQTRDFLRRRKPTVSLDQLVESGQQALPGQLDAFEEEMEQREALSNVLASLARLPEKYRLVITLRYQLGLSAKEIARQLGEPEGTIRNRVFRALNKLRERVDRPLRLQPDGAEEE